MPINKQNKVLIIGLDGATFDLIKPWVNEGRLPNFAHLMENGVYGVLKSTIPVTTPPAWTSFFTGKNLGKHGIFDFIVRSHGKYDKSVINATHRRAMPLWNIISKHGMKVGIINVPVTYPPDKVSGFIISGMLTPGLNSDFTYPKSLKKELFEAVPNYEIDFNEIIFKNTGDRDRYLKDVKKTTENRIRAIEYFMKNKEWDFFTAVFSGVDRIQHFFWEDMDPTHPFYHQEGTKKHRRAILSYYQRIDKAIGDMLENIPEKTTVIIASDHGFHKVYKDVYINNWLIDRGLLKLKNRKSRGIKYFTLKLGLTAEKIQRQLFKLGFINLVKKIRYSKSLEKLSNYIHIESRAFLSEIDWSRTKAYFMSVTGQYVMINMRGREPEGIVEQGKEYDEVREYIIKELYKLVDSETGEKIVETVYKKEEIYSGECIDQAPDLFVIMRKGYYLQEGFGMDGLISAAREGVARKSADHNINGILLINGPDIKKGLEIRNAEIIDVAPTILHIMSVPIPDDMDGRVLTDAFKASFLEENPIVYKDVKTGKIYSRPAYGEKSKAKENLKESGLLS